MFVILNDNEMSIAPPVGAMSSYLSTINSHQAFEKLKLLEKKLKVICLLHLEKGLEEHDNLLLEEASQHFLKI